MASKDPSDIDAVEPLLRLIFPEKVPITFPGLVGFDWNVFPDKLDIFTLIVPPNSVEYIVPSENEIKNEFEVDELNVKFPIDVNGNIAPTVIVGELLESVFCKAIEFVE
jgi:hypothetical protein